MKAGLRTRLEGLRLEKNAYGELLQKNRRETAEALIEVRDADNRELAEAARVLGISRQFAYDLLAEADAEVAV